MTLLDLGHSRSHSPSQEMRASQGPCGCPSMLGARHKLVLLVGKAEPGGLSPVPLELQDQTPGDTWFVCPVLEPNPAQNAAPGGCGWDGHNQALANRAWEVSCLMGPAGTEPTAPFPGLI